MYLIVRQTQKLPCVDVEISANRDWLENQYRRLPVAQAMNHKNRIHFTNVLSHSNSMKLCSILLNHDDVIKWKHFPRYAGNSPVNGEFPTQRPVTRSFDVFFDMRLNTRLSKQWWSPASRLVIWDYDVTVMYCTCHDSTSIVRYESFFSNSRDEIRICRDVARLK